MLLQTYAMQKKYGDKGDMFEYVEAGWQWLLGDYTLKQISYALESWLRSKSDLPTPSDIIKIIDDEAKYERISDAAQIAENKRKWKELQGLS